MHVLKGSERLNNIKAIKEMLRGDHKSQTNKTYGFSGSADLSEGGNQKREVGERWIVKDKFGNETLWIQKDGYRIKTTPTADSLRESCREVMKSIRGFQSCDPNNEDCNKWNPSKADEKINRWNDMCLSCYSKLETKLKARGEWEEFKGKQRKKIARYRFDQWYDQLDEYEETMRGNEELTYIEEGVNNESYKEEKWTYTGDVDALVSHIEGNIDRLKEEVYTDLGMEDELEEE